MQQSSFPRLQQSLPVGQVGKGKAQDKGRQVNEKLNKWNMTTACMLKAVVANQRRCAGGIPQALVTVLFSIFMSGLSRVSRSLIRFCGPVKVCLTTSTQKYHAEEGVRNRTWLNAKGKATRHCWGSATAGPTHRTLLHHAAQRWPSAWCDLDRQF